MRAGRLPPRTICAAPTPFVGEPNEKARNDRNDAAVALIEDDTFAYVTIRLRKSNGSDGRIEVRGHVMPLWWPAFKTTLERLISAGDEFIPPE